MGIPNGRLDATRVGSKLNVKCNSGYIARFIDADRFCEDKNGFASFDLLPDGALPFRCESKYNRMHTIDAISLYDMN